MGVGRLLPWPAVRHQPIAGATRAPDRAVRAASALHRTGAAPAADAAPGRHAAEAPNRAAEVRVPWINR